MPIYRGDGGSGDASTDAYASDVAQSAQTATTKANEAAASATAAAASATAAAASEADVAADASAAATSASNAATSETNAASSATAAAASASAASTSETNAGTSETNAATSASTATTQASAASTSATNAATSASNASTSETNAASSASTASTAATNASTSETNAATSASNASTSETNAASSASSASISATDAATSAISAGTSETNAASSATAASVSATNAATSETNASTSEANASTSETNAASSATAAATSATNAATSETNAGTSATNAASSATSAASSATSAANSYDSFDDRYLGTKASDPSTDNDGDSLVTGALYFNTTSGEMRVYDGGSWLAAYIPATGYLSLAGGTMTGALTLNGDPSTNLQAATKQYVDTIAAASLHYHDPVRVEQEGNLSATYDNGSSGVGATLTNNSTQAALVIDGVTLSLNDRVLIYEQTNGYENGIYTVTDTGSASTNWVLTRATDADSYSPSDPDSLGEGDAFFVLEGALGAGELYVMNTSGAITFGTTAINFAQVSSAQVYTGGTGISISGSEISTTALLNLVEDTSPQLGAALSANGFDINMGTNTITDTKVGQWDTAYSWGNHASAGYLTSETYTGTVTSVGMTVPTGLSVSGSPITSTGTLALSLTAGYSIPTTASQTNWNTAYGWGDHASAGYLTGITSNMVTTALGYTPGTSSFSGSYNDLTNKPTIPTNNNQLTNGAGYITSFDITTQTDSKYLRSDTSDVYAGRVLEFGNAGNGNNTSGAFLTIEGNTDGSGEGSGRLFFREHNSTTALADNYGMSIGYRGGATSVTTAVGNSWTGLSSIGNGEWGMWGHDNSIAGSLIAHGPRSGAYTDFTGLKVGGNNVWHAGNDGAGSGLDADNLDGYTWTSSGKDVRATEFYADSWFRNYNSGKGLYNQATTQHFYSDHDDGWTIAGGTGANWLKLRAEYNGSVQGWFYADNDYQGFLNQAGQWQLRIRADDGYSPSLYFREEGNESWSGNPGSDEGKIEYHSNRFYIASGSNSSEILRIRRSSDDVALFDNSGNFRCQGNITAYSDPSDIKLKENITNIPNALDKVKALNGVQFTYKKDGGKSSGVIAQEVEAVLPELVYESKDLDTDETFKVVRYGNMVGLLIEAIKELKAEIEELKNGSC